MRRRYHEITFATTRLTSQVYNTGREAVAYAEAPDALAMVVWLHKDALVAALDREIATESDDTHALSHEQREIRTAEIESDLVATERDEAALTWRAQSESLPCEFRSDINPIAVLGLKLITVTNGHTDPSSPLRLRHQLWRAMNEHRSCSRGARANYLPGSTGAGWMGSVARAT